MAARFFSRRRKEASDSRPSVRFHACQLGRWLAKGVIFFVGLASCLLLTACRTPGRLMVFDPSTPGWSVQTGQAVWKPRPDAPELAGELTLASNRDGRGFAQFDKTPFSLVLAQTTGTNWAIQFPPQRRTFARRGTPPTRFLWLHLRAALGGEPIAGGLQFNRRPDGSWRLENPRTGERVEGYLNP